MDDPNFNDPIVVIGGGISGVTCAKVFSLDNPQYKVTLVSASPLVKTISNLKTLGRSIDIFDVIEQNSSKLKSFNLRVINQKCIKLDSSRHHIQLEDGSWLKYGKLCICTGAKPRTIEIDNESSLKFIKYIRDTQTAKDFTSLLSNSKRILIAGNGGIANEVVYALKNIEIIWAIKDNTFGSRFFDAGAAKFFSEFLKENGPEDNVNVLKGAHYSEEVTMQFKKNEFGVSLGPDWSRGLIMEGQSCKKVLLETNVELVKVYSSSSFIPDDKKDKLDIGSRDSWNIYVELTNGKIFGCDLMIVGFGVVPNSEVFLDGNNFIVGSEGGILVNNEMKTSINDIYAAGDVCTVDWEEQTEHWFQMRLWTQARQLGFYAAKCIQSHLNGTDPKALYFNFEVFAHVTRFFGFRVVLLGLYNGQKLATNDYNILCHVVPREKYSKVIMKDGKMKGAILIGDSNMEETFEFLICNQIDLSRFGDNLLDDVIDVEDFFD